MFTLLKRISTPRAFWITLSAVVVLYLMLFLIQVPGLLAQAMGYTGHQHMFAIDASFNASPATIYALLSAYGETGRNAVVITHLLFDYVFPVVYSLFFAISLTLTWQSFLNPTSPWRWLILLPFLGGLSDCLENVGIITMALSYPSQLVLVARITSVLTILKDSLIVMSALLLLIGIAVVFGPLALSWIRKQLGLS